MTATGLLPTRSRPRGAFALTPLADIMFQLLIFFMLTTSLAPYSLVPMVRGAAAMADDPPAAVKSAAGGVEPAIWHLGQGHVRAGSARIDLADLPLVVEALSESFVPEIVLFVGDTARTEDLVSVLEHVERARFGQLRVMGR